MSDPHAHGGGGGSEKKINPIYLAVGGVFFVIFVIYFYLNPASADTLMIILHGVQALCIVAIGFMFYKLEKFRTIFAKNGAEIVKNYESKIKHHHTHVDEKAELKSRYGLALEHIHSRSGDEWKTGLIELDTFIRLALKDVGYVGDTTLELLNDAKKKGHKHVEAAEDIAYLREHLKATGLQFDFTKQDLELLLERFQPFKKTILPEDKTHHDDHHADHKH